MKIELEQTDIETITEAVTSQVVKALKPLLLKGRPTDDPLITLEELTEYLNVKSQWIYKRIQGKEMPYTKTGRFLRFRKSEIDRWLEDNSTPQVNPLSSKLKVVK